MAGVRRVGGRPVAQPGADLRRRSDHLLRRPPRQPQDRPLDADRRAPPPFPGPPSPTKLLSPRHGGTTKHAARDTIPSLSQARSLPSPTPALTQMTRRMAHRKPNELEREKTCRREILPPTYRRGGPRLLRPHASLPDGARESGGRSQDRAHPQVRGQNCETPTTTKLTCP